MLECSPSSLTYCAVCNKQILKGTIRRTVKPYGQDAKYWHLTCYKPKTIVPMISPNLKLGKLSEDAREEVRKWTETWNQQFQTTEEQVPMQYLTKAVATVSTNARRKLLEVFQYLPVGSLEAGAALACKEWFHVSRDPELWKVRYVLSFHPTQT